MKQIEIEDELYDFLLKRAKRIGESATEIISREIGMSGAHGMTQLADSVSDRVSIQKEPVSHDNGHQSEVDRFLNSREFLRGRDNKDRFLVILSWASKGHQKEFGEVVLKINERGRVRRYFAISKEELERSGTSVNAKKIPDSEWWVVTNNDTKRKKVILQEILQMLGHSQHVVELLCAAIEDRARRSTVAARGQAVQIIDDGDLECDV
jgi:negative modulator of initiation of replication